MVFPGTRLFRASILCPSGGVAAREKQGGLSGSAKSGGYAPDLAWVEGSTVVDEPGEGCTPVRENQRHEPRGFWGES